MATAPSSAPGALLRAARRIPGAGTALIGLLRLAPVTLPRRVVWGELADGRRMCGDLADHTQRKILFGRYEGRETAIVRARLRPGDVFVDVGAHVGWFATLAGAAVAPAGRVVACEAFPRNAALLAANVRANGLEDVVTVVHAAVSDADGELTIGIAAGSDSGSATAGPWAAEGTSTVPARRLDDVVGDLGPLRMLKIDVEGFEAHVLSGARGVLARVEHVLIELNRGALASNGSSPEAIVARLRAAGLTRHEIIEYPQHDWGSGALPDFCNLLASRG